MKLLDFEKYNIGTNHGFIEFDEVIKRMGESDANFGRDLSDSERSDAMMGCIASAVMAGRRVLVISLEMGKTDIMQHILSVVTGIPRSKLDSGVLSEEEQDRLMDGARRVMSHKNSIGIVDATGVNGAELCGKLADNVVEYRPEVLFVDGLRSLVGTVGEGGDGGEGDWVDILRRLSAFGVQYEVTTIA